MAPSRRPVRASVAPVSAPDVVEAPVADEQDVATGAWLTIVWNDPVNLMSYVTHVFRTYFGYSRRRAESLMMQVHTEGRAVVSSGSRERMETDVAAMHEYGLWATLAKDE